MGRCNFSTDQCNVIKQISESTFSLFFLFFVRQRCASGIEVFFVILDISAFESVIKCHYSVITTFKLSL
jgi:hypothetical protein